MPEAVFICGTEYYEAACPEGTTIAEAAALAGVPVFLPCGGKGTCGGCAVTARGGLSAPSARELEVLGDSAVRGMRRLACSAVINGDCTVWVGSRRVFVPASAGARMKRIAPLTGSKKCFAAAVDIGTTTVVIKLISLPSGKTLKKTAFPNPQARFGADVVSRLEACINGRQDELTSLINGGIEKVFAEWDAEPEFRIVTGNTAMLHIAAGLDARGLANHPFTPESLFGEWIGNSYYMRCAGAYIGGDVTASVLAADIGGLPAVLTDIGTNNETVLFDGEKFTACASAAGPAFEGAHISCGMPAVGGAICDVVIQNGSTRFIKTVSGAEPEGFCGSGLISAAAQLLKNGFIAPGGEPLKRFPDFGGLKLLPQDIAELQLAKSAVISGIRTLLHNAGTEAWQIGRYVPAGSFGAGIDIGAAIRIGMLPEQFAGVADKASVCACDGAEMLVLDEACFERSVSIAQKTEVTELADSQFFADEFISNLYFPYQDPMNG